MPTAGGNQPVEKGGRWANGLTTWHRSSSSRQPFNANTSGGFGLRGMSEQAQLAGGECVIQSKLGGATAVFVRLPIPVANEER
jgi:hypothetical protein